MTVLQEPQVAEVILIGTRNESIWSIATQVFAIAGYCAEEAEMMVAADPSLTNHQRAAFARAFDLLESTRNKEGQDR